MPRKADIPRDARAKRFKLRVLRQVHDYLWWNKRVRAAPHPRRVHHVRVALRGLQAAAWLLRHEPRLADFDKLPKRLKKRLRALSKIRELDVSADILRKLDLRTGDLRQRRKQEEKELDRNYGYGRQAKLEAALISFGAAVQAIPELDVESALERLKRETKKLHDTRDTSYRGLHLLRVRLKRVRYALRFLDYDDDDLKTLQEMLGRVHDYVSIPNNLQSRRVRRAGERARKETIRELPHHLAAALDHVKRIAA